MSPRAPQRSAIPKDLAGKPRVEVRENLAALNLKFNSNDFVTDPTIAANLVVTTDPAPGESVAVGTSVTLKISNGQVVMPSLFDLTKDPEKVKEAVTAALKKASPYLELEWEEVENSVVTPGHGDKSVGHCRQPGGSANNCCCHLGQGSRTGETNTEQHASSSPSSTR